MSVAPHVMRSTCLFALAIVYACAQGTNAPGGAGGQGGSGGAAGEAGVGGEAGSAGVAGTFDAGGTGGSGGSGDAGTGGAGTGGMGGSAGTGGTGGSAGTGGDAGTSGGVCGGATPHGCYVAKPGNPMGCPPQIHEQSAYYPPGNEWVACSSPSYVPCYYARPDGTDANCACDLGLHWLCTY